MEITNNELMLLIKQLIDDLNVNTEINKQLLTMLEVNNKQTKHIDDYVTVQLSSEQQAKNFAYNTLANLLGNSISTPTLINLK